MYRKFIAIILIIFLIITNTASIYSLSPLKQVENGTSASQVTCKEGLELIFKSTNGLPACVKPQTVTTLVKRGWGIAKITSESVTKITEKEVTEIARKFVQSSPTMITNGLEDTLELVKILESNATKYIFEAKFDTRIMPGYGTDVSGYNAITSHIMELIVVNGKVISATVDNTWDEINQRYLIR